MIEKIRLAKERAKAGTKKFNRELKKTMNTAIVAAFGFLIALSWRDLIQKGVEEISSKNPLNNQLISTIIITVISVLGILIVTKILSEKEENKPKSESQKQEIEKEE